MDTAKIITELVSTAKYQERPEVRVVVDQAIAEFRDLTDPDNSKAEIKEILNSLKVSLGKVLSPLDTPPTTNPSPTSKIKPLTTSETKDFEKYLTSLQLNNEQKDRLRLLAIGYNDSVLTAQEIYKDIQIKPLKEVLDEVVSLIQRIAFNLQPFLPETSGKILKQFQGEVKSQPSLFPRIL
jgi:methionyl-tRNA synthetase